MNKRPVITAGMLILIGETAYLAVWKNLIVSAVLITAAMIVMMLEIKSGNRSGQKKCSYLLLFCCLAAGIGIGVVADHQSKESDMMLGENVSLEGKVVDVYEGAKSLRLTVKAGDRSVVVFIKGAGGATDKAMGSKEDNNATGSKEDNNATGSKEDNNATGDDGYSDREKRTDEIKAGRYIKVEGILEEPEESTNPGSFDMADYYSGKGIIGVIYTERYELSTKKDHVMYLLGGLRERLEDSLYRYFRTDRASFLSAMLLGDKHGLDRNQKLMYQKNGLAHILAISGMHVSIIALAVEKILEMLGAGRKVRCSIVMILIILYGLMTGFAPPIIRAVIMLVLRYYAFFIKRSADVPTDMMLALLIMAIINPESVFTAGLQLSFAAAGAMYISDRIYINYFGWRKIIFFTERYGMMEKVNEKEYDRLIWRILRKIFMHGKLKKIDTKRVTEYAARTVLSTLIINLILSPLLIFYYYEIYPYSMLLGIVIVPTAVYVIAGGFITALLGMICMSATGTFTLLEIIADYAARFFAGTVNIMLGIYEKICNIGFKLPFSGINTGHTNAWVCGTFYIVMLVLTFMLLRTRRQKNIREIVEQKIKSKRIIRRYLISMYSVLLMFLLTVGYLNRKDDRIVVLDVGQGQAVIVHMSDGRNYILDGGSTSKEEIGEYVMIPALKYYGMSDIAGIFVSHTDEDHINGLIEMAQMKRPYRLKIGAVYMAAGTKEDSNYTELGEASGVGITGISEGDVVDGCFEVIYPGGYYSEVENSSGYYSEVENSGNDYSLVVLLDSDINGRKMRILFPGDISSETEEKIIEESKKNKRDISADILIAPHHGSKYSSSRLFLDEVSCEAAIISCGKNNPYGHPSTETLKRMESAGCRIIRTDKDGAVVIE